MKDLYRLTDTKNRCYVIGFVEEAHVQHNEEYPEEYMKEGNNPPFFN